MLAFNDRSQGQIQQALLYIDANLSQKLNAVDIAQHASMSVFHFQRLFSAYLGEPVGRYVLCRRLACAMNRLQQNSQLNIQQLAIDVGFDNHSAFSRAFKKHLGLSPSAFKHAPPGNRKNAMFMHDIVPVINQGQSWVEPKIVELAAFNFLYRRSEGFNDGNFFKQNDSDIAEQIASLVENSPIKPNRFISCFPKSPQSFNDDNAYAWFGGSFEHSAPNDWSDSWYHFQAGHWAMFEHHGDPSYLLQTWNRIYRSWLPQSQWQLREEYPFEQYPVRHAYKFDKSWHNMIYLPLKTA